jgi:hypothetical protein
MAQSRGSDIIVEELASATLSKQLEEKRVASLRLASWPLT